MVTRAGHFYVVRLVASRTAGFAGTYVKFGKAKARRYRAPLKLTKARLRHLMFASVNVLDTWERPETVRVPRGR